MRSSSSRLPSTAVTLGAAAGVGDVTGDGATVGDGEALGAGVCALVNPGCIRHSNISVSKISLLRRLNMVVVLVCVSDWLCRRTRVRSLSKLSSCVNDFVVLDKTAASPFAQPMD